MNTNFKRFKTLALRTMAGDALKVDVSDAASICQRILMTFFMCVRLYDGNKHCIGQWDCRNCNLTLYVEFCWTTPNFSLHSDILRVSVVLCVASQLSKLWRKYRGSTSKRKTFKPDSGVFLYTPKMRLTQFGG